MISLPPAFKGSITNLCSMQRVYALCRGGGQWVRHSLVNPVHPAGGLCIMHARGGERVLRIRHSFANPLFCQFNELHLLELHELNFP